jgi:hypothetical protein
MVAQVKSVVEAKAPMEPAMLAVPFTVAHQETVAAAVPAAFARTLAMRSLNRRSALLTAGLLLVTVQEAASTHRPGHASVGTGTIAWRKLKAFAARCRANGGTIVPSGYGSGVFACRMGNGRTRFCQAISNSQIECWSDQTLPPPRPSTGEDNSTGSADPDAGGGQAQPAPPGRVKGGGGCNGGVC